MPQSEWQNLPPEEQSKYPVSVSSLDPNVTEAIIQGINVAKGGAQIAGPFIPEYWLKLIIAGLGFAGTLAAGSKAYQYRKQRNTVTDEIQNVRNAAQLVFLAIDKFKASNSNDYAVLEEELKKFIGPKTENVIRALRGLPLKEVSEG